MSELWRRVGVIANGGSLLSVSANGSGWTWLATGGSILTGEDGKWRPFSNSIPMEQAGLVFSTGSDWLVAGTSGGLILTWDGGQSWASAWIDQVADPITCMIASPGYGRDITLLAGAVGSGVLRSTDGGRRWLLSNVGLNEFTVLALASAGDWSRRQVVFAGTANGIYRSSGGGRAWKAVGMQGLVVQALAAGHPSAAQAHESAPPDASGPWTVLAGTESDGLYRTVDGGYTWSPCGTEIGGEAGINALLCPKATAGEFWLAGTVEGSIWRSADNGDTWSLVCDAGGPVLALADATDRLLAGTSGQGLWVSTDQGLTWRPDTTLCAWGFRRLDLVGKDSLAALAPGGGVWTSSDAGGSWERALEASVYEPVLAYVTVGGRWMAARADGLWCGRPGEEPSLVLEVSDAPIVALAAAPTGDATWAGAADGSLWTSNDGGASWQALDVPFRDERLLGLSLSPEDGTPLAATFAAARKEATLWRYADNRWQRWLSRSDTWPGLALAPSGRRADGSWAALGGKPYAHTASGWQQVDLAGHEGDVSVITSLAPGGSRYLIAGARVLCRDAAGEWRLLPSLDAGLTPLDLCLMPSGTLLCLDASGGLWWLES